MLTQQALQMTPTRGEISYSAEKLGIHNFRPHEILLFDIDDQSAFHRCMQIPVDEAGNFREA